MDNYAHRYDNKHYDDKHYDDNRCKDNRYDDIINLPHHVSSKRPQMSLLNRAAQFSPFAALTGYEDQIASAGHRRCNRILLSEEEKDRINKTLSGLKKHDLISVTYFYEDPGTDGAGGFAEGEYRTLKGNILSILPAYRKLRIEDDGHWTEISFEDISGLTLL